MTLNRLFVLAAGCGLSSLIACGGSDGTDNPAPDAMIVPMGAHYGYVVSELSLPTQDKEFGLDLAGARSSTPDKMADNGLGALLKTVKMLTKLDLQPFVTTAVDKGQIVLLADLQTGDLANAGAAGFTIKLGVSASAAAGSPVPAPCASPEDMACRHHLGGDGTFTINAASPANATVAGSILNGTFNGGPGNLSLQLALSAADPITLNLSSARVKATSISATGMTAVIGGVLLPGELTTAVGPVVLDQLTSILNTDCGPEADRIPEKCNCRAGSVGESLIALADKTPKDCKVSLDETEATVVDILPLDVCSKASCSASDAISVAVQVKAVKASFPGLQ